MTEPNKNRDRLIYMVEDDEFYDQGKYWLHPVAGRFLETEENLEQAYPNNPRILEQWTISFKRSLMDWVSSGLIAKWLTRKRVWAEKFATWKEFCQLGLGKKPGWVKR